MQEKIRALVIVGVLSFVAGAGTCVGLASARSQVNVAGAALASPSPSEDEAGAVASPQRDLCARMTAHAKRYRALRRANELKRSLVRAERRTALLALPSEVSDWRGTIVELGTNGDGKAVLAVKLACDETDVPIVLRTWSTAITDVADDTLIPQSSSAYVALADLAKGRKITFSGSFVTGDETNGWREASLTEHGSMTAPDLVFRFSTIEAGRGP